MSKQLPDKAGVAEQQSRVRSPLAEVLRASPLDREFEVDIWFNFDAPQGFEGEAQKTPEYSAALAEELRRRAIQTTRALNEAVGFQVELKLRCSMGDENQHANLPFITVSATKADIQRFAELPQVAWIARSIDSEQDERKPA